MSILEGIVNKEFGELTVKRTTRKRKSDCTPEFRKRIRTFEDFLEEEMGNDDEKTEEELSEEEKKLPVTKEDQKNMVSDLKKFITESQGTDYKKFEESVKGLKEEIVKQNSVISTVRSDVTQMKKRIETLERREAVSEESIDAKIRERERKMEGRRRFEDKIKAKIEEEECKILVTGYKIDNKTEEEVVHDLIKDLMREGTSPKVTPVVEWMKRENAGK